MQCTMCDARIPDDARFCIICGAAVTPAQTGQTQRLTPTDSLELDPAMVTSAFAIPGFRLVHSLGIVRGLTVRSASVGGQIAAAFQSLGGGNIRTMNAIIGFGYDTTEIAQGMTEVLAYGTAVIVEPESKAA